MAITARCRRIRAPRTALVLFTLALVTISALASDLKSASEQDCSKDKLKSCFQNAFSGIPTCYELDTADSVICARKALCYARKAQDEQDQSLPPRTERPCTGSEQQIALCKKLNDVLKDQAKKCDEIPSPNAFRVEWKWVGSQAEFPPDATMLQGGHNNDPSLNEYLCGTPLQRKSDGKMLGIHFGKLLNDRCNVAYENSIFNLSSFVVAFSPQQGGYWAQEGDPAHRLVSHNALGDSIACTANYSEKGLFGNVSEHGRQIGEMRSGDCHFEYGGEEKDSGDRIEFFYSAAQPPPPPPVRPKPQPPGPCGTPNQPLCKAVCPAQMIYCGWMAQPDPYPVTWLTCAAGHTGECVQFVCLSNSYTTPYPKCN